MVWATTVNLDIFGICSSSALSARTEVPSMQWKAENSCFNLDHNCFLSIESKAPKTRLTNITCTIGTGTHELDFLEKLMENGMNIARLKCYDSHEALAVVIENIREASRRYGNKLGLPFSVAIGLELKGAEIRTGYLEGGIDSKSTLITGNTIKLTTDPAYLLKGSNLVVYVDYENIVKVVKPGNLIYIDNGLILLMCQSISGAFITCLILMGGNLLCFRGVNLPGIKTDLPTLSETDKLDLKFCVEQKIDIVYMLFVHNRKNVEEIRDILGEEGKMIKVVPVLMDQESLLNAEQIIDAADGIVIGRGDLGVETSLEKLFLAQKWITVQCNKRGKPVHCAKEFMETMNRNPRPRHSEITDVGNAVLDGMDGIILTTANLEGLYPIECLQLTSELCREAEAAMWQNEIYSDLTKQVSLPTDASHAVIIGAVNASVKCTAASIIVLTQFGDSAHLLSKYRPRCPIIAVTRNESIARQTHMYRGVIPFYFTEPELKDRHKDIDFQVKNAIKFGKKYGFIKYSDPIIIVCEWKSKTKQINTMRIMYAEEELEVIEDVLYIQ